MKRYRLIRPTILCMLLITAQGLLPPRAPAEAVRNGPVAASLAAEDVSIQPGRPFVVALSLAMDPDWHVYWKNPGDSGLPTTIQWDLPEGFSAGPLQWPVPERIDTQGLITYGYPNRVMLLTEIIPPGSLPTGTRVPLKAKAAWLACRVECIPGKAELSISLPVLPGVPAVDARWTRGFGEARARLPSRSPAVGFTAETDGTGLLLRAQGATLGAVDRASFLPGAPGMIEDSAAQSSTSLASGLLLHLARPKAAAPLPRLTGLLVIAGPGGLSGFEVDAAVTAVPRAAGSGRGLLAALLLAFVGGLILNLMPCVLPVISLKVLGFVRQGAGQGRGGARHGLFFTAGVLASFWIIAGVLTGLRAGGRLLGWGFQFQDPVVVVVTAVVFFLIGLNLLGVYEIGTSLSRWGGAVRGRSGAAGSFLSGLLAAAVATPCTAPFMGAAIGYALSRPALHSFAVFTALAVGMALPYLLLSAFPGVIARLPKPGPWMDTLRGIMAFPMLAAVIWMAFVLSGLSGSMGIVLLLGALFAAGAGAWIWGRWGTLARPGRTRLIAGLLALALALAGTGTAAGIVHAAPRIGAAEGEARAVGASASPWEPWSPGRVDELRRQGTPVFVDFTARWCLSCQVNEKVVLDNAAVRGWFVEKGVATLRADWTDSNDSIARALAGYGRAGVPLYVYYPAGARRPVLLPELLTPGIVRGALEAPVAP